MMAELEQGEVELCMLAELELHKWAALEHYRQAPQVLEGIHKCLAEGLHMLVVQERCRQVQVQMQVDCTLEP
jgi:hypothetical protein